MQHRQLACLSKVLCVLGVVVWIGAPVGAAVVPVRYQEGVTHGFLALHTPSGQPIAYGRLLQVAQGDHVQSRMTFRFGDGSLLEETIAYTQKGEFRLVHYASIQRGPAFKADTRISLDGASGRYSVRSRSHEDGDEDNDDGTLELPPDTYNGMLPIILKNLQKNRAERVHVVAFTPKPRLIEVEITPVGHPEGSLGSEKLRLTHYVVKPRLGPLVKIVASLLGKIPPDSHIWIIVEDLPAFFRFEGPLTFDGPVWRIDSAIPRSNE